MRDIMVGAAGIDNQLQDAVETGDHQIVKNAALVVKKHRIADTSLGDGANIGRGQPLQRRVGVGPAKPDLRHMRYVEQAGLIAGCQMLRLDAVGILHRHVPAGERHHSRALREVEIVKWGPAGLHGVTPVATQINAVRPSRTRPLCRRT